MLAQFKFGSFFFFGFMEIEMSKFSKSVRQFWDGEEGATLVEYGLLVGLLSIVAIASIVLVGKFVNGAFDKVQTEMAGSGIPQK